jgi:succinyl-diaminopimelate desuccinylase
MQNLGPQVLKIIEKIDHSKTISLVRDMIRIPTENPPGDEESLCLFLKDICESLGMETRIIYFDRKRPSLFAKLSGAKNTPYIFFNGHLDTVPCGKRDAWSVDPYEGLVKNGKVYGRGACDMKGALASMLTAIETIVNNIDQLNSNWAFTAVSDEEDLGRGTKALISSGFLNRAAFGIFGEPTNLEVVTAHRGNVWLEIEAKGMAAHGSTPGLGKNAILAVCKMLRELERIKWGHDVSINAGTINGGTKINIVPDFCRLTLDIRYPTGSNPDLLVKKVKKTLNKINESDHSIEFNLKELQRRIPLNVSTKLPIIRKAVAIVSKILCREIQPVSMPYTTDASFFVQHMRVPLIIFGPGKPELAHAINEYVDVEMMKVATEVYTALMFSI